MTFILSVVVAVLGLAAVGYAWLIYRKVLEFDIGNKRIAELSGIIHRGAMAFLKKEYMWLVPFVCVVGLLLWIGISFGSAFAFVLGAFCSAAAGWLSMYVATQANGRTTFAAITSPGKALDMAFSGGSIVGMTVVGIGLVGIAFAFLLLSVESMTAFGMGASSIALFARVGGGIYTKAADVGADLVGKVEEIGRAHV